MIGEHAFKHESVEQLCAECNFHLELTPAEVSMQLLVLDSCKHSWEEANIVRDLDAFCHSSRPAKILQRHILWPQQGSKTNTRPFPASSYLLAFLSISALGY